MDGRVRGKQREGVTDLSLHHSAAVVVSATSGCLGPLSLRSYTHPQRTSHSRTWVALTAHGAVPCTHLLAPGLKAVDAVAGRGPAAAQQRRRHQGTEQEHPVWTSAVLIVLTPAQSQVQLPPLHDTTTFSHPCLHCRTHEDGKHRPQDATQFGSPAATRGRPRQPPANSQPPAEAGAAVLRTSCSLITPPPPPPPHPRPPPTPTLGWACRCIRTPAGPPPPPCGACPAQGCSCASGHCAGKWREMQQSAQGSRWCREAGTKHGRLHAL